MSVTDITSIQLYTLRSLEDLDRILDVVADAGYRYVETVGSHLDRAAEVRAKLDARGLKASSSHVSLAVDVVHQETGDRSRGEVGVLGVGGAEDLSLAAIW